MMDKTDKKQHRNARDQEELDKDPMLELGYGVISYRNLVWAFFLLFSFFSLIMVPCMFFYSSHDGVDMESYAKSSIGNLGYAEAKCRNSPFNLG